MVLGAVVCFILAFSDLCKRLHEQLRQYALYLFSELSHHKHAHTQHVDVTAKLLEQCLKLKFAQDLLSTQQTRCSRRHRAIKTTLASLKKQQILAKKHRAQAKRHRLALKRTTMWTTARQTTLEQRIVALQQAFSRILSVGQQLQQVQQSKHIQAVEITTLKEQVSLLQGHIVKMQTLEQRTADMEGRVTGQIQGVQGECAALKAQLRQQQRVSELLESQTAVINDLRAQLSAGQQEQQQLRAHMALLQETHTQAPAPTPLISSAVQQEERVSEDYRAACLSAAGYVPPASPPTTPKVGSVGRDRRGDYLPEAVQRSGVSFLSTKSVDHRGDYLPEAVERSSPSYLSTKVVDKAGLVRVSTGSIPATRGGSFGGVGVRGRPLEGHSQVFDRLQMGFDTGSPKGRRQGNPFADSFTGKAEAAPASAAVVELAAASATTQHSTLPLLSHTQSQDSEAVCETLHRNTHPQKVQKAASIKGFLKRMVSVKKNKA